MFFRCMLFVWIAGSSLLYAYTYSDYDVDGVEDSIDACPNTPFDKTVDENGCEEGRRYRGKITLLGGSISAIDKQNGTLTNMLLYINYQYRDWDISFSTFDDIQNATVQIPNTAYLTIGHTMSLDSDIQAKIAAGTKQSNLQNDYYVSTYIDRDVNIKQHFFVYYSYTYAENSKRRKYNNFSTFSVGTGYLFTESWYSALSYDYSGASLKNTDDYQVLSWANTFAFSSQYYMVTKYSYGLNNATADHTISIQFGVNFE